MISSPLILVAERDVVRPSTKSIPSLRHLRSCRTNRRIPIALLIPIVAVDETSNSTPFQYRTLGGGQYTSLAVFDIPLHAMFATMLSFKISRILSTVSSSPLTVPPP